MALALFPCKEFPHGAKASEVAPVTMKHCTVRSGHKFWGWEIAINHPSKASVLEDCQHTKSSRQQKAEFLESIAELKDPTKSCKQSPEAFVLEYSAFIERVQRGVESFRLPNYEEVLPALSQEQLNTLIGLTDSCCKAMEDYLSFVKETCAYD